MNAGLIKQIKASIEATKRTLADNRAGHPDSKLSEDEENLLLDQLGALIELLKQFEE